MKTAVAAPRELDMHLVDAQQARRVIDRLCGYEISPLLWTLQKGLSAGRVQSAALHLLAVRERERGSFESRHFYEVRSHYRGGLQADLVEPRKDAPGWAKRRFAERSPAEAIAAELAALPHQVVEVASEKLARPPRPPFTTAALQQAASGLLDLAPKECMRLAQELFERGLITYHRTDSVRVAPEAVEAARAYLRRHAPECLPEVAPEYRSKASSQGAHEAVRPVMLEDRPELAQLAAQARALYDLIWRRFLASQSKPAVVFRSEILVAAGEHRLLAVVEQELEPGWRRWGSTAESAPESEDATPQAPTPASEGSTLSAERIEAVARKTKPPAAYTQASLVSAMEAAGIGRPSTYASTISVLLDRKYATMRGKSLAPTPLGLEVDDFLVKAFGDFVEASFTAHWEDELDRVADGCQPWRPLCHSFYARLRAQLERAYALLPARPGARAGTATAAVPTDKTCPACGHPMLLRTGSSGPFLACTNYPGCTVTLDPDRPVPRKSDRVCFHCGSAMLVFDGPRGAYLRCIGRGCRRTVDLASLAAAGGAACPACRGPMLRREGKNGPFLSCARYPKCRGVRSAPAPHRTTADGANGPGGSPDA